MSSELPPALADWSASLAALKVEVALALGPMLLRLDELVGRQGGVQGPDGEPDGFDGLSRRGTPERLLIGEWLLAEEIPEEFLRRAAERELLHLAPGYRHDPPHGVIRVLVDTGPGQLGAGRLVQFAALIVLHRRAVRLGAALEIGVLGTALDHWLTGDLPELLRAWLGSRSPVVPGADDLRAWTAAAGSGVDPTAVWLLCAPELPLAVPTGERPPVPRGRTLTSRESSWDAAGVRTVEVTLAAERLTLTLPPGPEAVRALRGRGFRRDPQSAVEPEHGPAEFRHPTFPGEQRKLVGRGSGRSELVWVNIGPSTGPVMQTQKPAKRKSFDGTLIAAGVFGRRIVVLVARGEIAQVRLIGKNLAGFDGLTVPLSELGLDPALSTVHLAGPPAPILFQANALLCRFDGWYRITPEGEVVRQRQILAAVASAVADSPLIAPESRFDLPADTRFALGHGWTAWSENGVDWTLRRNRARHQVTVAGGSRVLGVVDLPTGPGLITLSTAGLVLRLVQPQGTRTLTAWSNGDPETRPAVHPTEPLLAVATADGRVEIADLVLNRTFRTVAVQE